MARFLATRFALSIVTLFILSVIVFAATQLLPGDIGRNVLGPRRMTTLTGHSGCRANSDGRNSPTTTCSSSRAERARG